MTAKTNLNELKACCVILVSHEIFGNGNNFISLLTFNAYRDKLVLLHLYFWLKLDCLIQCSQSDFWPKNETVLSECYVYSNLWLWIFCTDERIHTNSRFACVTRKRLKWTSSVLINFIYIILDPTNLTSTHTQTIFSSFNWIYFHFIHFMNNIEIWISSFAKCLSHLK